MSLTPTMSPESDLGHGVSSDTGDEADWTVVLSKDVQPRRRVHPQPLRYVVNVGDRGAYGYEPRRSYRKLRQHCHAHHSIHHSAKALRTAAAIIQNLGRVKIGCS